MNYDFVRDVLPWFMSAITLYMTFLQGRRNWRAWMWGLINQVLWLVYIWCTGAWGLLPLNIGLWALYFKNLMLWLDTEEKALIQQHENCVYCVNDDCTGCTGR